MNSFFRQVLIGTLLGAFFLALFVHVTQSGGGGQGDALGKYLKRKSIGRLEGGLAGAVLGAAIGAVVGLLGKKYLADLRAFCQKQDWPFVEKVPPEPLAAYQCLLDEATVRSPRNLATARSEGSELLVLDATLWEKHEWAPQGGRVQKTVMLVPGVDSSLAAFHLAPRPPAAIGPVPGLLSGAINWLASGKGFQKNYQLDFSGRPADASVIDQILGAEGLAFFAAHPGWTVWSRNGHLLVWRESMAECKPSERLDLVSAARDIRDRLLQAPAAAHRRQPHLLA
jgi:hypothetical protein